jgi:hypothetical protein
MYIHVGESRMVGERAMKALRDDDPFLTTLTSWHLMNLGSRCAQLTSRRDSMTHAIVSISMKEDDGWSMMSVNKASSCHQRQVIDGNLLILMTLALWKSKVKMTRASEPVIPLSAPTSMRELMAV